MDNFMFYSPTCFVFGKDAENQAGALVRRFGGTRVLIHYGGGSAVRSGLIDRVQASLKAEGLSCFLLGGVKPNPRSGLVFCIFAEDKAGGGIKHKVIHDRPSFPDALSGLLTLLITSVIMMIILKVNSKSIVKSQKVRTKFAKNDEK